jgi:hypothetical protein
MYFYLSMRLSLGGFDNNRPSRNYLHRDIGPTFVGDAVSLP